MVSYYLPSEQKLSQMNDLISSLKTRFISIIKNIEISSNEIVLEISAENILLILNFLKTEKNFLFQQLIDMTAVDYPDRKDRFEVMYMLLSLYHNVRVRVKTSIPENSMIDSISSIFFNANWLEREVWDMFGIYFNNHPDLRRLLTDYGFSGHPLKKDFPLTGFVELSYDNDERKVMYKPVSLMQEFRNFDKTNTWTKDQDISKEFNFIVTDKKE